jgi:hypothetical protein
MRNTQNAVIAGPAVIMLFAPRRLITNATAPAG